MSLKTYMRACASGKSVEQDSPIHGYTQDVTTNDTEYIDRMHTYTKN